MKKIFKPIVALVPVVFAVLTSKKGGGGLTATQMRDVARHGGAIASATSSTETIKSGATPKELEKQKADREELLNKELASLAEAYSAEKLRLQEDKIQPYKKDIDIKQVALVWMVV